MAEDVAPAGTPLQSLPCSPSRPRPAASCSRPGPRRPTADRLALWVEVTGSRDGAYTYDIYFQIGGRRRPRRLGHRGRRPDRGGPRVERGPPRRGPPGLVRRRRGRPRHREPQHAAAARGLRRASPRWTSPSELAQRVLAVLDDQVNPSIAMHGGHADLVAVEEGVVYVRLSGGCQGCGLAAVTLSQGIEVALRDSVPEIVSVVDVTDHASGANPFYEPAKK